MPREWNVTVYRDVARAFFDAVKFSKEEQTKIESKVRQQGHQTLTYDAIRQVIQKLERNERTAGAVTPETDSNNNNGGSSPPVARGKGKTRKRDSEDDDDEPKAKKPRATKQKKKPQAKPRKNAAKKEHEEATIDPSLLNNDEA
ncbi:hypothetical protein M426DRAFT_138966 [Hypoxylon sp. CI-4A]|nr:hypothetical protein M426DRAFT_138966 [Hypoxylon sp. CI-4A]